jgi:NHLM bacteriocin system ABC transporter peptidase/ATP-binding protein
MILQMEAAECGAAALAIILAYYRRVVPLATLRRECGVSRDGSKCSNILKAAQAYGLIAKAYKRSLDSLRDTTFPCVVYWNFNHFLVLEGFHKGRAYLNDPAAGPRTVTMEEFETSYTGIVMTFEPGPEFRRGGTKPSILLSLWRRLKGSWISLLAAIAAALLLVVPGLVTPALMEVFVDKVLIAGLRDWGRPLVLGMFLAAALRGMLGVIELRILRRLQIRLAVANSGRFVRHLLNLPAAYYAQRYAGEVSSRIVLNDEVAEILSGRLASTTIDALMMVFYLIVMWQFNRPLTLVAATFAAANIAVIRWISRRRMEANVRFSMAEGRTAGVGIAGLQSIRTLKASGIESDFFARWAGYFANLSQSHQELSVVNYYLGVLPPLLGALMTACVLGAGGYEVINGRMSIGMLVAFQSLSVSFLQPVNNLVAMGATVQALEAQLSRLDDALSSPAQHEPPFAREPVMPVRLKGHVEFRNVTFGYSPVSAPVIVDLSFSIRPGQRIAFVGGSGSGKSTVARLLAGLYRPASGEILFDGIPAHTIPVEIRSNSLAAVDQDLLLFKGSVRDNLTLWDTSTPTQSIVRACRDALIDGVIDALPEGYSSELLEGAANLSGGQRQRLEIARALAGDPSILVMDEATSALDSETELLIDRNIRRRGCSCFIVAHRLSTVRDSDEIIVLDQGRVAERGTHDELLRGHGLYARLLADSEDPEMQAAGRFQAP